MQRQRRVAVWTGILLAAAASAADEGTLPHQRAWSPAGISSPEFESHAAFDPLTGDLYFVRSTPAFEGWRLLYSRCTHEGWSMPVPPPFAAAGLEADPVFSADGHSLYFISNRRDDRAAHKDLDIWVVHRGSDRTWGVPQRLPEPVNSDANEWYPRPGRHGWLYFGSGRPGGLGKTDIWRARETARGHWRIDNLGPAINTPADEFEAAESPDGLRLFIMGSEGLFESTRDRRGAWSPKRRLGADYNQNGTEVGALFSPSGHSLLYARDTKGPLSGEFILSSDGHAEAWPPSTPCGDSS
jgi:hypothetical protein